MYNYNKFIYQLKESLAVFSNKISKGLGKVESKFVLTMIYGLVKSQSSMLSDVARSLKEHIALKDTIDRLSKNLLHIFPYLDTLWNNYHLTIKGKITKGSIISFDFSDIIKPMGKKFENLGYVADGSDEHKIKPGYWVAEACALINERPVSVYSKVFSTITRNFKSINDEAFKALNRIYKSFGNVATIVMDRGFDDQKIFKYFTLKAWPFIIRVSHLNRIVYYQGVKVKLTKLIEQFKGKYAFKLMIKGQNHHIKCSYVKIKVPKIEKELTVVFVYFNKQIATFITNKEVLGKNTCLEIVSDYYKRWRIEEYFKYKKQQFDFENFRVRDMKRINALNTILSIALSAIELVTRHQTKILSFIKKEARSIKSQVYFDYYRLAYGIKSILAHSITGIEAFLCESFLPFLEQLAFF